MCGWDPVHHAPFANAGEVDEPSADGTFERKSIQGKKKKNVIWGKSGLMDVAFIFFPFEIEYLKLKK